jgi:hypothetical protein
MATLQRIDDGLNAFSIDELPAFTRTVLTSSPVLKVMKLSSNAPAPLPHVAVGTSASVQPVPALVRQGSSMADVDSPELPMALAPLLRLHKRAVHSLFHRWEANGLRTVPLEAFAQGVHEICGIHLSDDDLLATLQSVEPVRADQVIADPRWRSRPLDCPRLWRRLQSSAARLASQYIKESTATGTAGAAASSERRSPK